jgi:DNA-binding NtrC family response regulator
MAHAGESHGGRKPGVCPPIPESGRSRRGNRTNLPLAKFGESAHPHRRTVFRVFVNGSSETGMVFANEPPRSGRPGSSPTRILIQRVDRAIADRGPLPMSIILCIEDPPVSGGTIPPMLVDLGHQPIAVAGVEEALQALAERRIEVVLADCSATDATGRDVLDALRDEGFETPVILVTDDPGGSRAENTLARGAADYLTTPIRPDALRLAIRHGIETGRLRRENDEFRRELISLRRALGEKRPREADTGVTVVTGSAADTLNLKSLERIMISRALQTTGGHRARAAGLLGISERTLRNKLNTPRRGTL